MKITRIVKQQEDGSYQATMMLTEEQTAFLVNFALGLLVQEGTVKFFDIDGKDNPVVPDDDTSNFLEQLNPEDMKKA